jgi:hypothetical protein
MARRIFALLFILAASFAIADPPNFSYQEFSYEGHSLQLKLWSRHGAYVLIQDSPSDDYLLFGPNLPSQPFDVTEHLPNSFFSYLTDKGVMIGYSRDLQQNILYNAVSNTSKTLSVPFNPTIYAGVNAEFMNNRGNIAGYETTNGVGAKRSFVDSQNVTKTIFTGAEGSQISNVPIAFGDDDFITGISGPDGSLATFQGFLYREGAPTLFSYPGSVETLPTAINDNDLVAGYTLDTNISFLFDGKAFNTLNPMVAGDATQTNAVSDQGWAYGMETVTYYVLFLLWDTTGTPYNVVNLMPFSVRAQSLGNNPYGMDVAGDIYGMWLDKSEVFHVFRLVPEG